MILLPASADFQLVSYVSRPPSPPLHDIAREQEKGGKRDAATHFSRFSFGFLKSLYWGFYSSILFPKGGQNTILVTQIAKEKAELTIEAFRRTKEVELILYQVRLLWKPHFSLVSCRTPQVGSSNAKRFSRPWVVQFKSLVSATALFQRFWARRSFSIATDRFLVVVFFLSQRPVKNTKLQAEFLKTHSWAFAFCSFFCQRILTVILSFHLQKLNRLKTLIVLKDGLPIKKIGSFMKLKRDNLMFSTNFHVFDNLSLFLDKPVFQFNCIVFDSFFFQPRHVGEWAV